MLHCQNCGQVNQQATNFCRFCGTKLSVPYNAPSVPSPPQRQQPTPRYPSPETQYENSPPRPYSWKTDEYQIDNDRSSMEKPRAIGQFQPPPAAPLQTFQGQVPAGNYACPRCRSNALPRIEKRISTGGWITFAALLIFFFPLFWIGLLIKEETRVCPVCNLRMN